MLTSRYCYLGVQFVNYFNFDVQFDNYYVNYNQVSGVNLSEYIFEALLFDFLPCNCPKKCSQVANHISERSVYLNMNIYLGILQLLTLNNKQIKLAVTQFKNTVLL